MQQQTMDKPGPVTVHGRTVRGDTVRVVARIEVDGGDFVLAHIDMPITEAIERAERLDIPEMWPIVAERIKREMTRREP